MYWFGECTKENFCLIRSNNHKVYSVNQTKLGLSAFDDKRYILSNGKNTLPYGHYSILPNLDYSDEVNANEEDCIDNVEEVDNFEPSFKRIRIM